MSLQASSHHYCTPRSDEGPYSSVEIGFPSKKVDKLMPYAGEAEFPTKTVYGWVPVSVVLSIVKDNGGFDLKAMGVDEFWLSA